MSHRGGIRAAAWVLVLAAAGTGGCKEERRALHGKCGLAEEGQLVACDGPASALLCRNVRLGAVPCRGATGCRGEAPASCDESLAQEGDPCTMPDTEETACSVDHQKTLVCRDGRFAVVRTCRGPRGCGDFGPTRPGCDQTVGEVGDWCLDRDGHACSLDRKTLLDCKEEPKAAPTRHGYWGKLVVKSECPTTKGCGRSADDSFAVCDYRGSSAGDRCGSGFENLRICSRDGAAVLTCDEASHTFRAVTCPKGERCVTHDPPARVYPGVFCEKLDR